MLRLGYFVLFVFLTSCTSPPKHSETASATEPPAIELQVPSEFGRSLKIEHFRIGEDVLHIDWDRTGAQAPMTRYKGNWPAQVIGRDDNHRWTIDVYAGRNPKVSAAYTEAKNGYEADLDEYVDFLNPPSPPPPGYIPLIHALAYFFARFERKHYAWGNAVSFLSQGAQDTSMPTPENGRLWYEVWGGD